MRARAALLCLTVLVAALNPGMAKADSIRDRQWQLEALHVEDAWEFAKGAKVTVAVLDTGVDSENLDLSGQIITGPDYTGRSTPVTSPHWARHGTSMASIIVGHGHGAGRQDGVIGIAPQAKVLSIKVTWENKDPARKKKRYLEANKDAVARGIRYAADNGAQVINMSLGGGKANYTGSPTEQEAIDYAVDKGVVLVASMGNDGAGQNRRNFPAAYEGVIAVGAVDQNFKLWRESNRHDWVSVAAPGVGVVSAQPNDVYATETGTSAATAIVAGIVALIKSRYPKLSPAQVRKSLEQGATHKPAGGRDSKIGAGVVDALASLKIAHRLAKAGPELSPSPTPTVAAVATKATAESTAAASEESAALIVGILVGGSVLLVAGLGIAWRQRRNHRAKASAPPVPAPVPREPLPVPLAPPDPLQDTDHIPAVEAATPLADETWRAVHSPPIAEPDPDDDRFRPPWA